MKKLFTIFFLCSFAQAQISRTDTNIRVNTRGWPTFTLSQATYNRAGLMSAADKYKLDTLTSGGGGGLPAATLAKINRFEAVNGLTNLRGVIANDTTQYFLNYNGTQGGFVADFADVTSADDGAIVIVTTGGVRLKRFVMSAVDARWFAYDPLNGADDYPALQNRTGQVIVNYQNNETSVIERNSFQVGLNDIYYLRDYNSTYGLNMRLYNGVQIIRDLPQGSPVKSTYNGPNLNSYGTANAVVCIGKNLTAYIDTFSCNAADYYLICAGASVALPGITGMAGTAYPIGSNKFVIRFARKEITTTSYAYALFYQTPQLHTKPTFYIGDIVSGSNKIHNVEAELESENNITAGYYFNHPAFPIGTYVVASAGDSVTLSANATRTQTGAFVGHEYVWHTEGGGGAFQANGTAGYYGQHVFK